VESWGGAGGGGDLGRRGRWGGSTALHRWSVLGWRGPGAVGNWGGAGAARSMGGGELGRRWGAWATAGWAAVLGPRRPGWRGLGGQRVGRVDLSRVGGWNEKPVQ
jgi:hypothetical protein